MELMHVDVCSVATQRSGDQMVGSHERMEIEHLAHGLFFNPILGRYRVEEGLQSRALAFSSRE
jgi:hypothetical protein